ncbi:MAG: hypothetical protein QM820_47950 [Minicystis sp.]
MTVKLDTLGYVAATVSKRADAATLRQALDRAAAVAHARFSSYSPELREATFRIDGGGDDERLELEEAVADELTDLAEQGVAPLPTVERRLDLGRSLSTIEQRSLRARIDAAAEATLLRSGHAATWDFADERSIRVTFTPLSDQDARGVDAPANAFGREVAAIVGVAKAQPDIEAVRPAPPEAPPTITTATAPEAPPTRRKVATKKAAKEKDSAAEAPAPKRAKRAAAPETAEEAAPAPKRKRAATEAAPSAKTTTAGREASKKTAAAPRSSAKRTAAKTKASAKKA